MHGLWDSRPIRVKEWKGEGASGALTNPNVVIKNVCVFAKTDVVIL